MVGTTSAADRLFSRDTTAIFVNYKRSPIQRKSNSVSQLQSVK